MEECGQLYETASRYSLIREVGLPQNRRGRLGGDNTFLCLGSMPSTPVAQLGRYGERIACLMNEFLAFPWPGRLAFF